MDAFVSGETEDLAGFLAEEVVFSSPVTDYQGRNRVAHLLRLIGRQLEDLRTSGKWSDGSSETVWAFSAQAGGGPLDGMMREERDASGALVHITLFLRPYGALKTAIARMSDLLREEPLPEVMA